MFAASPQYVREVIHAFNAQGFAALDPKWSGGRPAKFGPVVRELICRVAKTPPARLGLPFTTWSLSKLAKFGAQIGIAALFAFFATQAGIITQISFVRPLGEAWDLGPLFVVWVLLMLTGAANGVNLADGMDGLAGGASALVIGAYTRDRAERHSNRFAAIEPDHLAGQRLPSPLHHHDVAHTDTGHAEAKAQPRHAETPYGERNVLCERDGARDATGERPDATGQRATATDS